QIEQQILNIFRTNTQNALQSFDLNRDGIIDRNELIQLCQQQGYDQYNAMQMADSILNQLDIDRNGFITVQDFQDNIGSAQRNIRRHQRSPLKAYGYYKGYLTNYGDTKSEAYFELTFLDSSRLSGKIIHTNLSGQTIEEELSGKYASGSATRQLDIGFQNDASKRLFMEYITPSFNTQPHYATGDYRIEQTGRRNIYGKFSVFLDTDRNNAVFLTDFPLFVSDGNGIKDVVNEKVSYFKTWGIKQYLIDEKYPVAKNEVVGAEVKRQLDQHRQEHKKVYARVAPLALAQSLKQRTFLPENQGTVDAWALDTYNNTLKNDPNHPKEYSAMLSDLYRKTFWYNYTFTHTDTGDSVILGDYVEEYGEGQTFEQKALQIAQQIKKHYENEAVLFCLKQELEEDTEQGRSNTLAKIQSISTILEMFQYPNQDPQAHQDSWGDKLRTKLMGFVKIAVAKNVRITNANITLADYAQIKKWMEYVVRCVPSNSSIGRYLRENNIATNGDSLTKTISNVFSVGQLGTYATEPINTVYETRWADAFEKAGFTKGGAEAISQGSRFLFGAFCVGLLINDMAEDGHADWTAWLNNVSNTTYSTVDFFERVLAEPIANALEKGAMDYARNAASNRNFSNPSSRLLSKLKDWYDVKSVSFKSGSARLSRVLKSQNIGNIAKTLGLATATIGVVVAAVALDKVVKAGHGGPELGFAIANTVLGVLGFQAAGMALFVGPIAGVSCFGPIGMALAVAGLVLFIVEKSIPPKPAETVMVEKLNDIFKNPTVLPNA
ncbi:MAG: EF-hand domain-containing protein, partial [Cyanobacteria bacterium J06592_8]